MIWGMFRQRAGGVWAQAWAVIGAVKEALWMARQKLIKGAYMSPPEVCRLARGLLERVVEVERATAGGAATGAKWRWPLPNLGSLAAWPVAASQALGAMATKRSGVVSQEAEDGAMRRTGGGRPAEERDEARASTSRRAEEDAWWQRARKGEEPTRSGMVSASPGKEAEEAPSSAGLQAQGAQSDAVQASPGPMGAGRPQERAGRWRGGSAGNFTPIHAKRHNCVRASFKEDVPEEVTIDRPRDCPLSYANKVRAHRSRVADGEGEVAEDGLKPTQPGGKMEDGGGEVGRQGTPLQDEREEGEMTSEEDADPTGRQVEHPGDKEEEPVGKPPRPNGG
ncbi:unnamed protein product [Lampetra fluviatilis]